MSYMPEHFTVWVEVPVSDLEKSVAFMNAVMDTDMVIDNSGPNPMAMFPTSDPAKGVAGHMYPGTPASDGSGTTPYFAAPVPLEQMIDRVKQAGGTVTSPIVEIPPGKFIYCQDLDGNSIAFFEFR